MNKEELVDKIVREWSWRCEKGYPDLNNEKDLKVLEQLSGGTLNQTELFEKKASNDSQFDEVIAKKFEGKEIPQVQGRYSIPEDGGPFNIDSKDQETFIELFKAAPSKDVGNGEVSLYWLFNYGGESNRAQENRGRDNADLRIDGNMVEVKSYPSHDQKITLGKFKADVESRKLITSLFGALNLTGVIEGKKEFVSEVRFGIEEIKSSFDQILKLNKVLNDPQVAEVLDEYEVFTTLKSQVGNLLKIPDGSDSETMAKYVIGVLLSNKLAKKPGEGNYVVNLLPSSPINIMFFKVPFNLKENILNYDYEQIKNNTGVESAEIKVNYTLFS